MLVRLLAVSVVVLSGCLAAPREVEVTLTPGPTQVAIEVRLHDVHTSARDELTQFRVFGELAAWRAEWASDFNWAPSPDVFEFSAGDAGLELTMRGSMSRQAFEACAQVQADGGVRCEGFPLARLGAQWVATPAVLNSVRLPKTQVTRWPVDAGVIVFRSPIDPGSDQPVLDGPSLRGGFETWRRDPAAARATLAAMKKSEADFLDPKAPWEADQRELAGCRGEPWCALRLEALRRQQLVLVEQVLRASVEGGVELTAAPESGLGPALGSPEGRLVPVEHLAPIDELRTRVQYDVVLDRARATGHVSWAPSTFRAACPVGPARRPAWKPKWGLVCTRLAEFP